MSINQYLHSVCDNVTVDIGRGQTEATGATNSGGRFCGSRPSCVSRPPTTAASKFSLPEPSTFSIYRVFILSQFKITLFITGMDIYVSYIINKCRNLGHYSREQDLDCSTGAKSLMNGTTHK